MGWYAIYVKAGQEEAICLRIERTLNQMNFKREYKLLVPKRKVQEKHQGNYIERELIMFPGYILVETEMITELYYKTKKCLDIYRYLKSEGEFQEISLDEISNIIHMVDEKGVIGISDIYIEGDIIKVTEGPLCNYLGQIKKIDKHKHRVKVIFMLRGQSYQIDLSVNFITKPNKDEIKAVLAFFKKNKN